MSWDAVKWAKNHRNLSCPQRCVLYVLAIYADENDEAWPSVTTLCAETGLCQKAVSNALNALCSVGSISRVPGKRKSMTYHLTLVPHTIASDTIVRDTIVPDTNGIVPRTMGIVPRTMDHSTTYKQNNNDTTEKDKERQEIVSAPSETLPENLPAKEMPEKKSRKSLAVTPKKAFGEFQNVKLTEDEHQKLVARLGTVETESLINRMDLYIGSVGKKYRSHYMAILNWASKEPQKKTQIQSRQNRPGSWDLGRA